MGDESGISVRCRDIDYYDAQPSAELRPGDIWHGLPSLGLFRYTTTVGIVVTPACDLQNEKVETITYLPIVPVTEYLNGITFVKRVKRELTRALSRLGITIPGIEVIRDDFGIPPIGAIEFLENLDWTGRRHEDAEIVKAAARLLRSLRGDPLTDLSSLKDLLGDKEIRNVVRDVILNRREDSHFLPRDPDLDLFSAISEHSIASFRHPMTVPLELLQAASSGSAESWEAERRRLEGQYRVACEFRSRRPIKKKRLKEAFLKDLITRFTRLYTRLGSPDFVEDEVERFKTELLA